MNEARPYASLSSGLLARKGSAKPAMRPQGYAGFEDLGWNDMGYVPGPVESDAPEHVPSSIAALTPLKRSDEPSVVAQQRAIAESFAGDEGVGDAAEEEAEVEADAETDKVNGIETPAAKPAKARPAPAPKAEVVTLPKRAPAAAVAGRKSAFTLRLDAERHLRLRLACAVTGRSAQQIVTGALDALLDTLPEVDALAERVPAAKRR